MHGKMIDSEKNQTNDDASKTTNIQEYNLELKRDWFPNMVVC